MTAAVAPRESLDDRVNVLLAGGSLERGELLRLAADLAFALEVHLTSAPVGGAQPAVASSKSTTVVPTCVPNDCDCRCKSVADHMVKELNEAYGESLESVSAWCIAALYHLRPHPARLDRVEDDGKAFTKRVLSRYIYLSPERAAAAESAINPGTTAEHIRRIRKAGDRHRQTGAYVPKQEDKPAQARLLRQQGDTFEQIAAQLDCSVGSVSGWCSRGR